MNYELTGSTAFQMAKITLKLGEAVQIERGSMAYHNGCVKLEGKMNSGGAKGLEGAIAAFGRSMVSGESFYITTATGTQDGATIAIAPSNPGSIAALNVAPGAQWRIRDRAFLACSATAQYKIQRQSLGKAIFAGTGGLFIMESTGVGVMLVSCYGELIPLECNGNLVVNNNHVVAWSADLDYKIGIASGIIGYRTGEGLVNSFQGHGKVLVQSRAFCPVQATGGST
jgi:uncharacterized protein (TIGR00266 family)